MKRKPLLLIFGVVALGLVAFFSLYRRPSVPARSDPAFYHTPEGVNATIQEQASVLIDALRRKDLQFIHGHMYYIQGLADALSPKLDGERKQRVDARLEEIKRIAEEIDNFSGRGNLEATEAGLQKLFQAFGALDSEFKREQQ